MSQVSRVVDNIFVYVGATFHYLMQMMNIPRMEGLVNIIVGLLVAVYTLTKIVDWGMKQHRVRRKRQLNINKQKRKEYERGKAEPTEAQAD